MSHPTPSTPQNGLKKKKHKVTQAEGGSGNSYDYDDSGNVVDDHGPAVLRETKFCFGPSSLRKPSSVSKLQKLDLRRRNIIVPEGNYNNFEMEDAYLLLLG